MEPQVPMEVDQEIRFAVVMYGGISLAIYMNGISQELYNMVRATAVEPGTTTPYATTALTGVQRVYRELAQRVGRDGLHDTSGADDAPIRTRFVVDILSGSSAGGINAIFLAKALANGQDMAGLKKLWLREGDIGKLINDERSADWGSPAQRPPLSLLSSGRMYAKLVDAFDDMESAQHSTPASAAGYVDELDLAVTATDLSGLPIPLRLSDSVVTEYRHRNVFRFKYDGGRTGRQRNDFHAANNGFLAFAARCTSAFPFAFEPMRLADIDPILRATNRSWHEGISGRDKDRWQPFFPDYHRSAFAERSFADGGYLDNKPFGHAIDALRQRRASVPVDRKLIYLEPSPESIHSGAEAPLPPNAVENVMAAFTLARYETIHDDLQRVVRHNRLAGRMQTLMRGLEEDVGRSTLGDYESSPDYARRYLDDLIAQPGMGVSYGGYHRLKVATVTDEVAAMIAAALGASEESDERLAIRYLVRAWRAARFGRYRDSGLASESMFLLRYDLSYRLRRLEFVLLKIDQLAGLGQETRDLLEHMAMRVPSGGEAPAFRQALASVRASLLPVHDRLHDAHERLHRWGGDNRLADAVAELVRTGGLGADALHGVLAGHDDATRRATAEALLKRCEAAFERFAQELADEIARVTRWASEECERALHQQPAAATDAGRDASALVTNYYTNYERYDLVVFPALQTSDIGEEFDHVDVLRISPRDATAIVEERPGRMKLAGTALMNFGAFLEEGWRKNDLLWGRLDGAERLIAALVSEPAVRRELTAKAHREILAEEFDLGGEEVAEAMARSMRPDGSRGNDRSFLAGVSRRFGERPGGEAGGTDLAGALSTALAQRQDRDVFKQILYDAFKERYEVDRRPDPRTAVEAMARSTRVIGRMFEDIASSYNADARPGRWIAKLGAAFWGLVEVAVPNSLGNLFFRHWLKLLYAFQAFIIAAGLLLGVREAQWFGIALLVITAIVHAGTWLLGEWMLGRRRTRRRPPSSET